MKLSELKGERAIEVIADLIVPVTSIASDQKNLSIFKKQGSGERSKEEVAKDLSEKIPTLLKTHKKDVLDILCAFNPDAKPEEMSVYDIINGVSDLLSDKDFLSLFLSVVKTEDRKQPTESSAEQEHSEPES